MKGVTTLPIILLMGGILIEVAVAAIVVANTLTNTFFGERLSAEAYLAARSGAQDAILKIIRTCPLTGCPSSYSLTVGSRSTADVTISRDLAASTITVDSTGTAFTRKKKIEVLLGVDSTTGQIKLESFKEVAF